MKQLLLLLAIAMSLQADWTGHGITLGFPSLSAMGSDPYATWTTLTVPGTWSYAGALNGNETAALCLSYTIAATQITVTLSPTCNGNRLGMISFGTSEQLVFVDTGGASLSAATLDGSSNVTGMTGSAVTFDATHVYVQVGGLTWTQGQQVVVDLSF